MWWRSRGGTNGGAGRLRRVLAAVVVAGATTALSAGPTVEAQSADDELRVTAMTTYTVDLPAGVVHTRAELSLLNTAPDRYEDDRVYLTYFAGFLAGIQADAANLAVTTAGGTPVEFTTRPEPSSEGYYQLLDISFPSDLRSGSTLDLVVTYDLAGFPNRSEVPTRVNEAYALFDVIAFGDPQRSTVQLIAPVDHELDLPFGAEIPSERVTFGDHTVITFDDIDAPGTFSFFATAADEDRLVSTSVTVGNLELVFQSWPDDPEWLAFATDQATAALVELEEAIGLPFDQTQIVEVRQSAAPSFEGYAGWYDLDTGRIEIGEELDEVLLLHELSHGWFNDQLTDERWITEGLADTFANELADEGDTEPQLVDNDQHFQLRDWPTFVETDDNDAVEQFGYAASHVVIDAISDDLGAAGMRDLIATMHSGMLAYPGEDGPDHLDTPISWDRFIDLVEAAGGSEASITAIRDHALTPDDLDRLDERDAMRVRYDALVARGDGWMAPDGVRQTMAMWRFDGAAQRIDLADAALTARDDLAMAAADAGLTAPDFEDPYQDAATIEAIVAVTDDLAAATSHVDDVVAIADLVARERTPFARLALYGEDFTDDVHAAGAAFTANRLASIEPIHDDVRTRLDAADEQGRSIAADIAEPGLPVETAALGYGVAAGAVVALGAISLLARRRDGRRSTVVAAAGSGGVVAHVDPGGDAPVDGDVQLGVGARVDLDEDALAGTVLGGMDRVLDVPQGHEGEGSGAAGIVERPAALPHVGDAVLELHEDVGTVIDAETVAGAEVLVDPDAHDDTPR